MTAPNSSGFNLSKPVKRLIIWGSIALLVLIGIFSVYGFINDTNSEGVAKTSALEAQYSDNQNELSSYVLTVNESLGIADRQNKKLNEVLLDAVKGRYDNEGSLNPGTGGQFFSAITEAYPDLAENSKSYMKVQDHVISGRKEYKKKQSKLLDMVRDFETWRDSGLMKRQVIKFLDFPGDSLSVTVNGRTFKGEAALEQIRTVILTKEARDAYETGTDAPLITPSE